MVYGAAEAGVAAVVAVRIEIGVAPAADAPADTAAAAPFVVVVEAVTAEWILALEDEERAGLPAERSLQIATTY